MPRAKTWAELTRRQRQRARAMLRQDIDWLSHEVDGEDRDTAEALRAALRELREPRREDDDA